MKKLIFLIPSLFISLCSSGQSKTKGTESKPPIRVEIKTGKDTFQYFSFIDTAYSKYVLPNQFKKPVNWLKADENRKGVMGDWYVRPFPKDFTIEDALALIDTTTDMSFGAAKSWCIKNYRQAFPYLVARLSDKRKIGLNHTADLIIWDRIGSGDLKFYGHGGVIEEDVFTIAGRASWILNELTGEKFAVVHGNLTAEQAVQFKQLWIEYIARLKK